MCIHVCTCVCCVCVHVCTYVFWNNRVWLSQLLFLCSDAELFTAWMCTRHLQMQLGEVAKQVLGQRPRPGLTSVICCCVAQQASSLAWTSGSGLWIDQDESVLPLWRWAVYTAHTLPTPCQTPSMAQESARAWEIPSSGCPGSCSVIFRIALTWTLRACSKSWTFTWDFICY